MSVSRARRPAMTDVARRAGVSHQTVSRVLNEHPSVSAPTRAAVLAAVAELGYRPNSAARALVTGRSGVIGVVTFAGTLYGPACMLYGIEAAASEAGFSVSVAAVPVAGPRQLGSALRRLQEQGVEGVVVVVPVRSAGDGLAVHRDRTPVVALAGTASDLPLVGVDQAAGARLAIEHLLALGHPTVWHVAGPDDWLAAGQRADGWRRTLSAAGIEAPDPLAGDWSPRSGYEAGKVLAARDDVTAVFVANDLMALGVLRALREHGRTVPGEVSVVGWDNMPESGFFSPPLTTVHEPFDQIGRRSVELLLAEVATRQRVDAPKIEPTLVVRASTARYRTTA